MRFGPFTSDPRRKATSLFPAPRGSADACSEQLVKRKMSRLPPKTAIHPAEAPRNCDFCPRLAEFRRDNQQKFPAFFNGAVPSFGSETARLLIVGLAPGLKGANWSGRPFTGDAAGDILYETLLEYGFATGKYDARPDDGLQLVDTMITNAVRCVPPQNKPVGAEINNCRPFLAARIRQLENLRVIMVLGRIAHDSSLRAQNLKPTNYPFKHGARHRLADDLILIDSYHCSRYNLNTRRLTKPMFEAVFDAIRAELD